MLRFTPYAYAKLVNLRDFGKTEVGGFGVSNKDDLFLIEDILVPKQECTVATVDFDAESMSELAEEMYDKGYEPRQFSSIWIHTHPGNSASPSNTDYETFYNDVFSHYDWSIMFILAKEGDSHCELQFTNPMAFSAEIEWEVDYGVDFTEFSVEECEKIYKERIIKKFSPVKVSWFNNKGKAAPSTPYKGVSLPYSSPYSWNDDDEDDVGNIFDMDDDEEETKDEVLEEIADKAQEETEEEDVHSAMKRIWAW